MRFELNLEDVLRHIVREEVAALAECQPSASPWMTVEQAGEYLGGIGTEAVRGLLKRRELPFYKPNGRVFVSRDDCDEWMRRGLVLDDRPLDSRQGRSYADLRQSQWAGTAVTVPPRHQEVKS